jgi:hypothetical protein
MVYGHMGTHRDRHQRSDLDIDQLFSPEAESRSATPTLIFTQPADRNQLFADEVVDFAEERVLVPGRSIEPAAQPYRPRWKRSVGAGSAVLRVFLGASALVVGLAIVLAVMEPKGHGDADLSGQPSQSVASTAASRSADVPPPTPASTAAPSAEGPVRAAPDPRATPQEPRRVPDAKLTDREQRRPESPPRPVATSQTVAAEVPPPSQIDEAQHPATPDVPRPDAETTSLLGQPVAPPPAEVPPIVVARERGLIPPEPPASGTAAATGTSGTSLADSRGLERDKVRAVLSGYEKAYSQLDAAAAARLYPAIDSKALSRAFSTLSSQQILFEDCRIQVFQATAHASCAGTARWTPRVGGGSRQQARRWNFDLKQVAGNWQIGTVKVQ